MSQVKILDCTLRDGGYYNDWDFDVQTIEKYLQSMEDVCVDAVELGLRSFNKEGFKGPCAYTTENFINNLNIPENLLLGVMVNASELINYEQGVEAALEKLFIPANQSRVKLVRIACHVYEFEKALEASTWLKNKGYIVGYNLMQIAGKRESEIHKIATLASTFPIDVLYFADSLGGLLPSDITHIVNTLRKGWKGELGIHTHDNMGYALANSLQAFQDGVVWIDGTVTGMGRGPGNAKTETLVTEFKESVSVNITTLLNLIDQYFKPLQVECGWGTNLFYHLAGKYGIHPTFIQEMLSDSRYNTEDILSVINYLKLRGGQKYNKDILNNASDFYHGTPVGTWNPLKGIKGKEVLILGTGLGVKKHKSAIEEYIRVVKPYVIALNTDEHIAPELIDVRAACHPARLLADCKAHVSLQQALITPYSMLDESLKELLANKEIYDFGICKEVGTYKFKETYCHVPKILVIAYALAIATSGKASSILMAGFDGYPGEDSRNEEMNDLLNQYKLSEGALSLTAVTPSKYQVHKTSIYQLIGEVQI